MNGRATFTKPALAGWLLCRFHRDFSLGCQPVPRRSKHRWYDNAYDAVQSDGGSITVATSLAPTRRYTVNDLADFPDDGKLRELVDGRLVEWDVPSWRHGLLETELAAILRGYVRQHHLGLVASGEVMSRILGRTAMPAAVTSNFVGGATFRRKTRPHLPPRLCPISSSRSFLLPTDRT
jgi:hypothetical protein